ncbi:MAG TPA: hypothetical protein VLF71_02770 [Candidatus Saccharimonadales bacterium]|nr:hypothetical protein [Candidatus Saccharimonadales bacterium]
MDVLHGTPAEAPLQGTEAGVSREPVAGAAVGAVALGGGNETLGQEDAPHEVGSISNHETAYNSEQALFAERVAVLQAEAESGVYTQGKRLDVLFGVEVESQLVENGARFNNLDERMQHERDLAVREVARQVVRPTTPIPEVGPEEMAAKLATGREEARAYVEAIPAHTPEEAVHKAEWLADIENYGPKELIYARLYREFSAPQATTPRVPADSSYEDVGRFSEQSGWLEFRWGRAALQVGWEDTPGISEHRLAPCPPTEAARRKGIVTRRFADIAADYGMGLIELGTHLNVSAYMEDEHGQRMPILGIGKAAEERTKDALAGIGAGITDGAWLNTGTAELPEVFDVPSGSRVSNYRMGHVRNSIRVHTDRIELRDARLAGSLEQGVSWAMAGVLVGLHDGYSGLGAQGYEVPALHRTYRVVRTEAFDKMEQLEVQRALEQSGRTPDGGFALDTQHNARFAAAIAGQLIGARVPPGTAALLNEVILRSLRVQPGGGIHCDQAALQAAFEAESGERLAALGKLMEYPDVIATLVDEHTQSLRIEDVEVLGGSVSYRHLSPEAREQTLLRSPVARVAYGDGLPSFAAGIRRTGEYAVATNSPEDVIWRIITDGRQP